MTAKMRPFIPSARESTRESGKDAITIKNKRRNYAEPGVNPWSERSTMSLAILMATKALEGRKCLSSI